ncbi:MAG: ASKHA domain-containing protein [Roseovarius sp.]
MGDKFGLTFRGEGLDETGKRVSAAPGETVLAAARRAGIEIVATCGERGRCRSCRVKVLRGQLPPATIMDQVQLGAEEVQERFRLSCQMPVTGDAEILLAPPRAEAGHKVLAMGSGGSTAMALDSGVIKECVRVELPDDEHHQSSDLEELARALPVPITRPVRPEILRLLPAALRGPGNIVTATLFDGELIDLQIGDHSAEVYGMAFDIGTTSIVGSLIDLRTGEELAAVGGINPQSPYGGDLMSRIAYIQEEPKRLQTLRAKVLGAVNGYITEACEKAGVDAHNIHKLVVVGNTCMHHIFLGIDPTQVGLAPYAPTVRAPLVLAGHELPLKTVPNARICMLPLIAGFVGADTVAAVLATRIYDSEEEQCLIDIGTNGEVVMGRKGRLVACSAPAGPALEGGQIRHGMRGAVGAIERVRIGEDISLDVIGGAAPVGICGSGLIDAAAQMIAAGVMTSRGLIRGDERHLFPDAIAARLRHANGRDELVLCRGADSGSGDDITLNQSDIRQLQLAKGAICSGVMLLQHVLGLSNEDLGKVFLCGGFGNYLNVESAVAIRLLPPVPIERIAYFGNAAGLGAQMALLSETERARASQLAREIEHVSLATHPAFQDIFLTAMEFPKEDELAALAGGGTPARRERVRQR